jgi:large subunit ribosomal protein L10
MATQQKIELVEQYSQKFKDAKSIFLADFRGMTVEQTNDLRRDFRTAGVEYRILKNTLALLSFKNVGLENMSEFLKGCTAFAFSDNDPVAPIKVIKEYTKKNKDAKITIKGCVFEGKIFTADKADALAKLPTRDALLAQFVGLLQAPMSNLVGVLQATGQKLTGVLESVKNQKTE